MNHQICIIDRPGQPRDRWECYASTERAAAAVRAAVNAGPPGTIGAVLGLNAWVYFACINEPPATRRPGDHKHV